MHEVSLVADLIVECERRAAGRPIRLVRVRHASSIPETTLRQAFEMLTADSGLAGAALESQQFVIELACACGFSGPLGHDDLVGASMAICPACGEVTALARTAELELLEVRTAPPG